jgi:gliding motility-associated-like protein
LPNVSTTNKAANLLAGDYVVKVYDANNCYLNITYATLKDLPNTLTVNIGADTTICPGEKYVLNAGSFDTYTWQDGSHLPTYNVVKTGNYYVTVADKFGCTAIDSAFVTVNCDDIFFPTAFSPNGDGKNDLFGPLGNASGVTNYTFQVFNRYGNIVFSTTNPTRKWDGKLNGNLQTGVYVWYVNYSIRSRKNLFQRGTVLIVK